MMTIVGQIKMFKSYEKAPTKDTDILGTDNTEYKLYKTRVKYTYKVTLL